MGAFTVGMTGAMIHDMNKSSNHCNGSIFGNNWSNCCSPFENTGFSPFGNFGCGSFNNFGMMGMFPYNNSMNMFGMGDSMGTNPYLTQMGLQNAYMLGIQQAEKYKQQQSQLQSQQSITKRNNEDAGDIDADVTNTKGQAFDEATNAFADKDSTTKEVVISTKKAGDDSANYKSDIKELAQSYIKHIDTDGDGHISEEEFIEHEIEAYKEQNPDATEADIQRNKNLTKSLFKQMNLNQDTDGLDWKEMAATLAAYDAGGSSSGKLDGKISKNEYNSATTALGESKFGNAAWSFYKKLFPDT